MGSETWSDDDWDKRNKVQTDCLIELPKWLGKSQFTDAIIMATAYVGIHRKGVSLRTDHGNCTRLEAVKLILAGAEKKD
jgi:hypothetical protein